jgi:hypothetical protein
VGHLPRGGQESVSDGVGVDAARSPPIHRALAQAVDRAAGAGRLPRRAERAAGRLRRTAPGRAAGRHGVDRGHGQLLPQLSHEQIAANALVAARCRSAAPGPLRRLQRHAGTGFGQRFYAANDALPPVAAAA